MHAKEEIKNHINARLDGLHGSAATLAQYCCTHGHLEIEIERPEGEGTLFLVLEGCISIECPIDWSIDAAMVELDEDLNLYVVTNESPKVRVTCGNVFFVERPSGYLTTGLMTS